MRIVENTPDRLILEHRRTVRPLVTGLSALLFLAMAPFAWSDAPAISAGLALIAALLAFGTWVFDGVASRAEFLRVEGTVTIRHTRFGRGPAQVIRLDVIRHAFTMVAGTNAQVTGTMMDGGQTCPALDLRQGGAVPLSAVLTRSPSQRAAVAAINAWLGRTPDRTGKAPA